MDRAWLAQWRVSVTAQVSQLLETFQSRFGFEPGVNQLGPPAAEQVLASLQAIVPRPAADLIDFYRCIGQVSLPDVGNGYFIHPADLVAGRATDAEPCRIGPPHELDVLVYGSDGGGALYAVPAAKPGPVYRLRECIIKDGIALAGDIQIIAADYLTFCNTWRSPWRPSPPRVTRLTCKPPAASQPPAAQAGYLNLLR